MLADNLSRKLEVVPVEPTMIGDSLAMRQVKQTVSRAGGRSRIRLVLATRRPAPHGASCGWTLSASLNSRSACDRSPLAM